MTHTHTFAILEVSREVYDEVAAKLNAVGYEHTIQGVGDEAVIDMHGIALQAVGPPKEPPLLQCADCKNTESCAGAMARMFNHGRCMHCGGYFKVVRA